MKDVLGIGVIGCGVISKAYLERARTFSPISFVAVSDRDEAAARRQADAFGVEAMSPDALLAREDVDIVLNLTPPTAHAAVSTAALEAGKHVYSEKPFVLDPATGRALLHLAASKRLRLGSAPDTFLGGSHQLARHLVDAGAIGRIVSGTCFVMNHGMEDWHPSPDFFYQPGGGPLFDLGPYYIANLVQLLGPIRRVSAQSATAHPTRRIGFGPRIGEDIPVEVPTTVQALLGFASGAAIMFAVSWDVWQHDIAPMALYGETGTLHVPDPNFFGGAVRLTRGAEEVPVPDWDHPFSKTNSCNSKGPVADFRAAGLADMAQAIIEERAHRCGDAFALHVIDVLCAIDRAASEDTVVQVASGADRPEALDGQAARTLMA